MIFLTSKPWQNQLPSHPAVFPGGFAILLSNGLLRTKTTVLRNGAESACSLETMGQAGKGRRWRSPGIELVSLIKLPGVWQSGVV